jgi:zinc protease
MMEIEADRFMNLDYPLEDFQKEAGAVLGEYNKSASSPYQTLFEKLRDAAYTRHTYKHTTIGFLRDIEAMPQQYEYSRSFFKRFYRPENCILLTVGDVDPVSVQRLAQKHYGAWTPGLHRFKVPAEPPQGGERRVEVAWPSATLPYLVIGYHGAAFSTTSPDLPALDLISQLLFSGSAPLYQKLVVEEQEVDLLSGGQMDHRDPYLFTIITRVKREERIEYVERAITGALEDLRSAPPPVGRLDRVKSHLKYAYAMGLDTAESISGNLAHYLALTGEPDSVNQVYALYDRLTLEDVAAAARRYFTTDARTVVTLRHQVAAGDPGAGSNA